jgi:FSR family fosmidomycin resistance protein-like MFS transporter
MSRNDSAIHVPQTKYLVLWALCFSHLFNDSFQSLITAALPLLKEEEGLLRSFIQVGLVMTVFQLASSICQPIVGWFTDKYPQPYSLPFGMTSTMLGILLLSYAWSFPIILLSVALIGFGSAVFHPEASRLAYMASGGRLGVAQSLFQTGGNAGASVGPLLAAIFITPYGRTNIAWFAILVFCAILWMIPLARWYKRRLKERAQTKNAVKKEYVPDSETTLPKYTVYFAVFILLLLVFSKTLYSASFGTFLTFYLIEKFKISIQHAQLFLFAYLFAVAAGTFIGGPIGDRVGRKWVIWVSILGPAPFALLLPYVHLLPYIDPLWGTCILSMLIGATMSTSFPAIVVFAQELMPGKVGTVGGLFFGFSFGSGAIASSLLGGLADFVGIEFVYECCAFIPLIGLITWFLPNIPHGQKGA